MLRCPAAPASRGKYTLEFKQEAVRQVKAGRAASVVAETVRAEM